jgi:hypothetical protein
MGELALALDFGIIKAGEMLAFPGAISERSGNQISGSADELIRNISGMMQDLVASLIEKRTAAEFEATRALVFPKYVDAALALSSLIHIMVPQQRDSTASFFANLSRTFKSMGWLHLARGSGTKLCSPCGR